MDAPGSGPDRATVVIPVASEKQAMDWSLTLASQEILCLIRPPAEGLRWTLEVDPRDAGRALRTLRQYHLENRARQGVLTPRVGEFVFHWAVLLWCVAMVMVFSASNVPGGPVNAAGAFDTRLAHAGQVWRAVTATFLHAGPEHLTANLTFGFLLIGLAMGRAGVGCALAITLLAGSFGNLFAWAWRGHDYIGVGSSGVVMGALGLLAASALIDARRGRVSRPTLVRSLLGGALLFILLGTAQKADVLAHAGGFIGGAVFGSILAVLPDRWSRARGFDAACAVVYGLVAGIGWMLALH
ncbi:MAG: rhomboid family intramembrane serine protease [Verrucomicrobiales bacterium]|nr:rhomboid family intramembrane serine protease [Verrucomicrobiales bacterium]